MALFFYHFIVIGVVQFTVKDCSEIFKVREEAEILSKNGIIEISWIFLLGCSA